MNFSLQEIYNRSPIQIQNVLFNFYGFYLQRTRFSKKFEMLLQWLEETEKWSNEEIKAYQKERLIKIIDHAYQYVPYYRKKMKEFKLVPNDFKKISDLQKLPILTKDIVKSDTNDFISTQYSKKKLKRGRTSGTTGSPLELYWDNEMVLMNNAVDWRQKRWAGFKPGDKHAVLFGRMIVPTKQDRSPFWRYNSFQKQLWMSVFHISEKNLILYVKKLESFNPKFVEGYPSALYIIAKYINEYKLHINIKAVFTTAETLFDFQREEINKAFSCEIYDYYGLAERVIFAIECPYYHSKHLSAEYSITEIVDFKNEPITDTKFGYMVGTTLHNSAMPLIRYKTDDINCYIKDKCNCGINLPLISSVTTKADDIIRTKDGKYISPSVITNPLKPYRKIVESQIIQIDYEDIIVNIVTKIKLTKKEEFNIIDSFKDIIGENVNVRLRYLSSIDRQKSGKYKRVISKIEI